MKIAYNGASYGGWQIQPNTITVQQKIEEALKNIAGYTESATGCGRTDAGVHARVFYAHFDLTKAMNSEDLQQLVYRMNRFLPQDISVESIRPVVPEAHARFSAIWREYQYVIIREKDPFNFNQAFQVSGSLNIELMNICSALLLGRHDFESFSKVHTQVNNFFCDIQLAQWEQNDHYLKFTIRADRFLRNMVRAVVGTLLDVGREKITLDEFQQIINSHDRCNAGYSVPAKGLTLAGVGYPEDIFLDHPVLFKEWRQ